MIRKRHLIPGARIKQDGEVFTLIEPCPSWRSSPIWIEEDIDEFEHVNYASERWLVVFDEGFRTHRYVKFFHSKNIIVENE